MTYYIIRVYKKLRRRPHYVKLTPKGHRYVFTRKRGIERFYSEREALWVVVSSRWQGNPIVEPVDDDGVIGGFNGFVTYKGRINRRNK